MRICVFVLQCFTLLHASLLLISELTILSVKILESLHFILRRNNLLVKKIKQDACLTWLILLHRRGIYMAHSGPCMNSTATRENCPLSCKYAPKDGPICGSDGKYNFELLYYICRKICIFHQRSFWSRQAMFTNPHARWSSRLVGRFYNQDYIF